MGKQITLTFARHGQTIFNTEGLCQGHTDSPLTDLGVKQAHLLGKKLREEKFDIIYTSDLYRAHNTALIIAENSENGDATPIKLETLLRERSVGIFDGQPGHLLTSAAEEANLSIDDFNPEGSETKEEVKNRAKLFFYKVIDENSFDKNGNFLAVTHGVFLKYFLEFINEEGKVGNGNGIVLVDNNNSNWDFSKGCRIKFGNTSITKVNIEKKDGQIHLEVLVLNDTSHLDDATHFHL